MSEKRFIKALEEGLGALPQPQREDILADYRAHFFEARERGKGDAEIAAALGEPRHLARNFVADYHLEQIKNPSSGQSAGGRLYHFARASLLLVTILAFNFFFMLWPVLLIAILLFVGLLLSAIGTLVGVAAFAFSVWEIFSARLGLFSHLTMIFYSIALLTAALLGCIVFVALARLFMLGLFRYVKLNAKAL